MVLEVVFYLVRVRTAVNKDFFDSGTCQELEGVFDQGCVGEGKETLAAINNEKTFRARRRRRRRRRRKRTRGFSSVKGLKRVSNESAKT